MKDSKRSRTIDRGIMKKIEVKIVTMYYIDERRYERCREGTIKRKRERKKVR